MPTRRIIALSLLLFWVAISAAQTPGINVEIYPPTVEIYEQSAQAVLIVRNESEFSLNEVKPALIDSTGVQVEIEPEETKTIPPGSAFVWNIKLNINQGNVVSRDLYFKTTYKIADKDGNESGGVNVTKLTVQSSTQEDSSSVLSVTTLSSLTELNDFRPGYVYLEVKNVSSGPITLTDLLIAEKPEFLVIQTSVDRTPTPPGESKIDGGFPLEIPAGASRIIPIYVQAGNQVRPGEHLLVFEVRFQRNVNGQVQTGSSIAEHKVAVKVFGEGEILGAFTNITTFLFIPGLLMVVIAAMVWKIFVPSPYKDKLAVGPTQLVDPRFLVVVITLSLLMAWQVYPRLTEKILPIGRRDFLYGYGFQDVLWMWLFSLAIGTLFSIGAAILFWLIGQYNTIQQAKVLRWQIQTGDDAMDVLDKLVYHNFDPIRFEEVTTSSGQRGYIIEMGVPNKEEYWVAPKIGIWWAKEDTEIREKFEELEENEDSSLKDMLQLLKQGLQRNDQAPDKGIASVNWDRDWIQKSNGISRLSMEKGFTKTNTQQSIFIHH